MFVSVWSIVYGSIQHQVHKFSMTQPGLFSNLFLSRTAQRFRQKKKVVLWDSGAWHWLVDQDNTQGNQEGAALGCLYRSENVSHYGVE